MVFQRVQYEDGLAGAVVTAGLSELAELSADALKIAGSRRSL